MESKVPVGGKHPAMMRRDLSSTFIEVSESLTEASMSQDGESKVDDGRQQSSLMMEVASPVGLPWANGTKPSWLERTDGLIVDFPHEKKSGGMLLITLVNEDASSQWEQPGVSKRPKWLRAILAANKAHVQARGHAMVLRWKPTEPQLTSWQRKFCDVNKKSEKDCQMNFERENVNWEKHLMLADYLKSPRNFSHVLMMDADAMLARPDLDTVARMAVELEKTGKELFTSSEDWLKYGEKRINGGVIMAKNTNFTRNLFDDLWECHRNYTLFKSRTLTGVIGCGSNEMISLNEWMGRPGIPEKILLTSGKRWNRGGETLLQTNPVYADEDMFQKGMKDPELEIMHFMGGAKGAAVEAICNGTRNFTLEGPDGYGCSL